jgi:N-ethylmaleimide reductase
MPLEITIGEKEGVTVLNLTGHLTFGQEDLDFRNQLDRLVRAGKLNVALNLRDLHKLDTAGLGTLLFAVAKLRKAGGNLAIFNLNPSHIELLAATKLATVFQVFHDEQDAIDSFFPDREINHYDILQFVESMDAGPKANTMNIPTLFSPVSLGAIEAPNRLVMAPLTRMRAGVGRIPTALMAEYYKQRATAGLIVTEATAVSRQGTGCPHTPGVYTVEQIDGWQRVNKTVHQASGRIFLQLWHMGRISHPSFQEGGELPVAPSAIAPRTGQVLTETGMQPYVVPRALKIEEMASVVAQYAAAARSAKTAGFDGVEIHNANGYLLDQFLRDGTNRRTDDYGGSAANRARLTLEVTAAVTEVWGADRVGIRFSPGGVFNDMHDSNPLETFSYVLRELNRFHLAYAHLIVSTEDDLRHGAVPVPLAELRQVFQGPLIVANGFNFETATRILADGQADAVAFGRLFLANPDLPERFRLKAPLNRPDESTFYGGAEKGYTDYPALVPELIR